MGDTYSQSTDPSDDDGNGGNDANAAGPSNHVPSSQVALGNRPARGTEEVQNHYSSPSPHAQPAHQHESLQLESSVTLDTQHDPAEDADMQEGGIGVTCTRVCACVVAACMFHQAGHTASTKSSSCCLHAGDLMDVDTVPIPTEHLDQDALRASPAAGKSQQHPYSVPDISATSKPARPKAVTRRRR